MRVVVKKNFEGSVRVESDLTSQFTIHAVTVSEIFFSFVSQHVSNCKCKGKIGRLKQVNTA